MKKLFCFLLALCLFLTACGVPPETGTETAPALPPLTPSAEDSTEAPETEPPAPVEEDLPVLESHSVTSSLIQGPSGSVYALSLQGSLCKDPIYGDVDGDEQRELLYRSACILDGDTYEGIFVYGLEKGWPVFKGSATFRIGSAKTGLTEDGGRVCYSYQNSAFGFREPVLLPVTLEEGRLWVNDGRTPEGLDLALDRGVLYGVSFRSLIKQIGRQARIREETYILWKEPGVLNTEADLAEEGMQSVTCAAVSNNGVTVTAFVYWGTTLQGKRVCEAIGIPTPSRADRPEALVGLTEKQLTGKLGDPCFELQRTETFVSLCWFTSDGKLLTVELEDKVVNATLTDLPVD